MKSAYHHRFWLRVAEAARTGWACLIVAVVLLYVPKVDNLASVPVLAPVLAVLVAGPPLGTVVETSVGILAVAVPALASTIAVLQVLRPPISKFAAIACTGVSSYVIAYLSETHLLGRKTALAQISIVYITAHYNPDKNFVYFPLKMIAPDVLGVCAAIVATLFPVSRLAFWEVRESAKSAARGASQFFKTLVLAVIAPDASTFGSMHLHCKVLAKASTESLEDLKKKQVDIWWELWTSGARHACVQFAQVLDCLNLHLTGMEMALDSGNVLYTPEVLRGNLQGTFMKVVDQCNCLLDVGVELPWSTPSSTDRMSRHKLIEEGKEILNLFDVNYLSARVQDYYSTLGETACADVETEGVVICREPWKHRPLVKHSFRGRVSMLFFIFNMRLYLVEAINLLSAGHSTTYEMHQIDSVGPTITDLEQSSHGQSCQANDSQQEAIIPDEQPTGENFTISKAEPIFPRPDDLSMDDSSGRLNRDSSSRRSRRYSATVFNDESILQAPVLESDRECENPTLRESVVSGRIEHGRDYENPTVRDAFPTGRIPSAQRQCSHRNAPNMEKIIKSGRGVLSDGRTWKLLRRLGIKPSKTQSKRSLKTSLSMILATLFGILVLQKPQSFWAPVTVGFIIGNFQGGSWRISNLRLQGTVLGSIYGFLALSASQNHRWAILLLLVPWVIFMSYIRFSPAYGYSGLVAAFTAAILMLGNFQDDIQRYALDRITATFVGILCFVVVETVVLPERAVVLVRQELVSSLISLRDCVGAIVSVYTEQECIHCRGLEVTGIKQLEKELRASIAKQAVLSREAALEPDLWFVPFPADVYSKLIVIQGRMLDLLFFIRCSLHATAEDCLSTREQMDSLIKPLKSSLTALQEEVLATIDYLQEALQVKIVHEGKLDYVKRWLRRRVGWNESSGDVEQPHISRPDPNHPLLMLGNRHRAVDGTPLNLQSTIDGFEQSFENVLENLIDSTNSDENKNIVKNSVMTSVGSLTFSLHSLLRETASLDKAVNELLQAESPWSTLDFYDTYSRGVYNVDPPMTRRE